MGWITTPIPIFDPYTFLNDDLSPEKGGRYFFRYNERKEWKNNVQKSFKGKVEHAKVVKKAGGCKVSTNPPPSG